ncbi:MAG: hypothetical protein ACOC1P_05610, partial [Minisyncoccales bacterium]
MIEFVYFSSQASTSGKFLSSGAKGKQDLMKAGRMDIALHVIISSFFLSNSFRKNRKLHLIFYGAPDPPKHIEIQITDDLEISKKDLGNLIKKILYKYKQGKKIQAAPGCFIEKKSFLNVIEELLEEEKEIFVLDGKGENIRDAEIPENSIFILGDHNGLPKKEIKRISKKTKKISVGPKTY